MDLLQRALEIAHEAHVDQVDKAGRPYIGHVLRVVESVDGVDAKVVAALHDVVEDNPDWSHVRMTQAGIPWRLIPDVAVLTHYGELTYAEYIEDVARRPIATAVKIADLRDHLRPDRVGTLSASHVQRYRRALAVLEGQGR